MKAFGRIVDDLGLCWGGHWKRVKEGPHLELRPPVLGCADAAKLAKVKGGSDA